MKIVILSAAKDLICKPEILRFAQNDSTEFAMSFSSDAKTELCQLRIDKKSAAVAESYGVLLYASSFSAREARIITANEAFAARLPRLFKRADAISDFLTTIGASSSAMGILTAKIEREMRNTVTRQINCDSANADKTVAAAQEQIEAIRHYGRVYGLETLPEALYDTALLRITNPEASLADLARLSLPPVTKSCLNHRLKKIMELAEKAEE